MLAYDYPLLGAFWTTFVLGLFAVLLYLLFRIFADIFRSPDMGGFAKVLWIIFVIVIPVLGIIAYLLWHGHAMSQRDLKAARAKSPRARRRRRAHVHELVRPVGSRLDASSWIASSGSASVRVDGPAGLASWPARRGRPSAPSRGQQMRRGRRRRALRCSGRCRRVRLGLASIGHRGLAEGAWRRVFHRSTRRRAGVGPRRSPHRRGPRRVIGAEPAEVDGPDGPWAASDGRRDVEDGLRQGAVEPVVELRAHVPQRRVGDPVGRAPGGRPRGRTAPAGPSPAEAHELVTTDPDHRPVEGGGGVHGPVMVPGRGRVLRSGSRLRVSKSTPAGGSMPATSRHVSAMSQLCTRSLTRRPPDHRPAGDDERHPGQIVEGHPGRLAHEAAVPGEVAVVGGEEDQRRVQVDRGEHAPEGVVDLLHQPRGPWRGTRRTARSSPASARDRAGRCCSASRIGSCSLRRRRRPGGSSRPGRTWRRRARAGRRARADAGTRRRGTAGGPDPARRAPRPPLVRPTRWGARPAGAAPAGHRSPRPAEGPASPWSSEPVVVVVGDVAPLVAERAEALAAEVLAQPHHVEPVLGVDGGEVHLADQRRLVAGPPELRGRGSRTPPGGRTGSPGSGGGGAGGR